MTGDRTKEVLRTIAVLAPTMADRLTAARRVLADWLVCAAARVDPDWYARTRRVRP